MTSYKYNMSKPPVQEGVRPAERKCLKCRRKFKSSGIHQRLCHNCRSSIKKSELTRGYEEVATEEPIAPVPIRLSDMTFCG
jgi:PHP family Zn ribbon phosphoesterase